jgi:glutathione S-transferase
MPQFTLISHHLCPFVQRAAIMLLEKGIAFDRVNIDLQNKPDWFLAISPTGKVPLLKVHNSSESESVLFESVAICEFLEEVYPQPALHPAEAITKAQHRAWVEFATSTLADAWGLLNASDVQTAQVKSIALRGKLEKFELELTDSTYFSGEQLSMVDISMAPVFRYFDILELESINHVFEGLNRVTKWRRSLALHPSIRSAVAEDYAIRFRKHLLDAKTLVLTTK